MHAIPLRHPYAETEPVLLFVALGAYTAPLAQLIWALHRGRKLRAVKAMVLVDRRGLDYLSTDLLEPDRALDQLREVLGEDLLHRADVHVRVSREDRDTMWDAVREAIALAGDMRIVFGLTGGARRTETALETAFFQLLAREHDLLVDVRLADPRVDEDTGFFFPEQKQRRLTMGHAEIDARQVSVELVEIDVPRVSALIASDTLTSYESAVRAVRSKSVATTSLIIDLVEGIVSADGEELDLSIAERFWYAYLASRRAESVDGWVQTGQASHEELAQFLEKTRARRWASSIRTRSLRLLLEGEFVHDEDLRNLRGKTVQRIKKWCRRNRAELEPLLVPQTDGNGRQRIPLAPHRIQLRAP